MAETARRAVLRGALWGAALALLPAKTRARPLVSKTAADYQDHPRGRFNCALCTQFRPPHACLLVAGEISPNGWCRFFDLGD